MPDRNLLERLAETRRRITEVQENIRQKQEELRRSRLRGSSNVRLSTIPANKPPSSIPKR